MQIKFEKESPHPFKSHEARDKYLTYYDERAKHWPIVSTTKMVETSFGKTFIRISGPENRPPLVLLPGDSENSLAWIPQIKALSVDYRTYVIDHVFDYGRSIYSRPMKKPIDFVQWMEELFTKLQLNKINLMGFSYGGWQASLYALSYPQRLRTLILIAPSATVLSPGLELLIRGILQYIFPARFIIQNYLYWQYADSVRKCDMSRKIIDDMVAELLLSTKCFKRRGFVSPTVLTDQDWERLEIPTLFLVGENDVMYSAQKAIERLNSVAPKVITSITSDAGHDLREIKSEWVNNEVLKFLSIN